MSKLPDLLEFRTIPDTARYLSNRLHDEVTESDVLRLALDWKLKLSVNFPNGAKARCGRVSMKLTERIFGKENYEPPSFSYIFYADGFHHDIREVFERDFPPIPFDPNDPDKSDGDPRYFEALAAPLGPVSTITGTYDLALSCGARKDIESRYSQIVGGPPVFCTSKDRIIVIGQDGEICEIHDECPGQSDAYAPAIRLPADGMLVVRSEALKEFMAIHLAEPAQKTASAPQGKTSADQAKETTGERYRRIMDYVDRAAVKEPAYKELAIVEKCTVDNIKRIYKAAKKRFSNR